MLPGLVHRGPDSEGLLERPGLAAGIRRLAVVDLSDTGAQPMVLRGRDRSVSLVLAYNGEVYNDAEVRRALDVLGPTRRFILHPVDAIFPDTPVDAVMTMIEAWQRYW